MPKQKKAAAKPELKAKTKPETFDQTLKNGKKSVQAETKNFQAETKNVQAETKVEAFAKLNAKASRAKPVVLKLPRPLKKAARACAKDQGLKLRAWIVELIQDQLTQASASAAGKSLQTR